jgi:hypothetical protein
LSGKIRINIREIRYGMNVCLPTGYSNAGAVLLQVSLGQGKTGRAVEWSSKIKRIFRTAGVNITCCCI